MKTLKLATTFFLLISLSCGTTTALAQGYGDGQKSRGQNKARTSGWNASEYSGRHSARDIEMAMYSKGFAWLSGSPADNEKLSIGKNAQFFGFVAIRYQSGRVAKRGELGRAFYTLSSQEQRAIILEATKAEKDALDSWWETRREILLHLQNHLYTGEAFDNAKMNTLGNKFGLLNAEVALFEARAFAAIEDRLSSKQWDELRKLRKDPGLASTGGNHKHGIRQEGLDETLAAQYEDLFAKAFTWLTGSMEDNKIFPLGQPAQFFGFVSIRHKSGHGASRGKISKQFSSVLNTKQRTIIKKATSDLVPLITNFKLARTELLLEMGKLRTAPDSFSLQRYNQIAGNLGIIEIQAAIIEAQAYRKIRTTMTDNQNKKMMDIRSEYILNSKVMERLTPEQRGIALYRLCQACHENPQIAPRLSGVYDRPIASLKSYDYSGGMRKAAGKYAKWTSSSLDTFLTAPDKFAPGTKMSFKGLLDQADRDALIDYLKTR